MPQALLLLHVGAVLAAATSSQLHACSSTEGGIWLLWVMLAVQAAVPCSRVRELPDKIARLQDYCKLLKIAILTSSAYMSSQVRGEEKPSTKKWDSEIQPVNPGPD